MKNNNWFEFAREDLRIAEIAFNEKIYNQTCFHAQQAAEKFLKGYLLTKSKEVPKIHFLDELLNLCVQINKDFANLSEACSKLDDYYIPTRYPDALPGMLPEGLPGEKDADEAVSLAKEIMQFVEEKGG
ncbi:MAG: HEPN domain-containing protein [Candidatus Omnitrophica bacterium]|nr:HEPN domain-containing protein [Candidatus Omnitrophota bacterium]MBU1524357.1 HEPN domain-containing protein [Candidatus Omnitrophota bacterium]